MAPALQAHRETLLNTIRGVRTRWRWKVVLRSLTVLVGAGVGTILVAAYGLEQFRFSPAAIVTARIVTYLVLAGLGWFFFVRPLARRVSDQQVALYLEEHEPSLHELLLSAVEAGSTVRDPEKTGESAAMLERLVESAIEKCQETDLGRGLERRSLLALGRRDGGIAVRRPRSSPSGRRISARARWRCSSPCRASRPRARTASTCSRATPPWRAARTSP